MKTYIIKKIESSQIERLLLRSLLGYEHLPGKRELREMISLLTEMHLRFLQKKKPYYVSFEHSKAYSLYYGLINSIKLYGIFKFFLKDFSFSKVFDFGCGGGSLPVCLKVINFDGWYFGVDNNQHQIKLSEKICAELSFNSRLGTKIPDRLKFDLIVVSNVLCELTCDKKVAVLSALAPLLTDKGIILIIEPGDRRSAHELISLKQTLVELSLKTIFPCSGDFPCPLSNTENWCHCFFEIERGDLLLNLDRMVGLNHHRIKFSLLVVSNTLGPFNEATVVQWSKSKTGKFVDVCYHGEIRRFASIKKKRIYENWSFELH
ncbi:MAG: small ribosomal subunit Rsm22 family protein [Deltaproteobacteria bacterium]|nr:small ribosomal subunit Rsm22 family protein [Deltaproteobacteria bacterium]